MLSNISNLFVYFLIYKTMDRTYKHGLYTTYDSDFVDKRIAALATTIQPGFTVTLDSFREEGSYDTKEIYWFEGLPFLMSSDLKSDTAWNNSSTSGLVVSEEAAEILNVGDMIMIDSEVVIVASVDRSANTISVHGRGHGSTSPATHSAGATIYLIASSHVEGTTDSDAKVIDNFKVTNYYSLIEERVEVTYTGRNQAYEDIKDKLQEERRQALERAMKKMNRSILFSIGSAGSKTTPRSMSGVKELIDTYASDMRVNANGAMTEAILRSMVEKVGDQGGMSDLLLVAPREKRKINAILNSSSFLRVGTQQNEVGMIIDYYQSEIGPLRIVSDPLLADLGMAFLLDSTKIRKSWFVNDTLRFERESNVNSRVWRETLQGQMSLIVEGLTSSHCYAYGLTA